MDRASLRDQETGERLLADDQLNYEKDEEWIDSSPNPRSERNNRVRRTVTSLSILLNAILIVSLISLWLRSSNLASPLPPWPNTLYSPAESAVEYEIVTFNSDFPEDKSGKTEFYGPSKEADKAWADLMDPYIVQISGYEAAGISRPTSQISKDPDYYITSLDVYHQLHCLNDLRKFVIQYNTTVENGEKLDKLQSMHKFHCIDSIRQSLMCNADLSLIHWYWAPHPGKHFPNATTTHICRKWSKIEEWAIQHRLDEDMYDAKKLIE